MKRWLSVRSYGGLLSSKTCDFNYFGLLASKTHDFNYVHILASKVHDCSYVSPLVNTLLTLDSNGLLASQEKMTNYHASRDKAVWY